jgi:hypothetical protein
MFVSDLEADLKQRDFRTWVDRSNLEGGDEWLDTLQQAIENCDVLLVILSPDATVSKFVKMEYRHAQCEGKVVIPLHYRNCERVPMDLNGIQWIDFRTSYEQALQELLPVLDRLKPSPKSQRRSSSSHQGIIDLVQEEREPPLVPPQPALTSQDHFSPPTERKRWAWIVPSSIILIIVVFATITRPGFFQSTATITPTPRSPHPTATTAPIGHQSIKLPDGESITVGMSDGNYLFRTQSELDFYKLTGKADGESCIRDENSQILTSRPRVSYVTVVAVVSLSDTKKDHTYSFGLGNATLQGFCLKQMAYNKDMANKVKLRILIANVGVQDPHVLQQTMPIIRDKLIQLSQQDDTFIGAVGFTFSATLDDHKPGFSIDTMDRLKAAGIPVISSAAATSDPTFDTQWTGYFYRMNPGNEAEAKVAAYYAYNKQQKRTAFVFFDSTSSYSSSLETAFITNFQAYGGAILSTVDVASTNFTAPLPGLDAHPPDMIFCACVASSTSPDFTQLSQDLQPYPNLSDPKKVMLMGADGLYNPEGKHIIYRNMFFTALGFPDAINNICNGSADAQCSLEQLNFYANYCSTFDPQAYEEQPDRPTAKCDTYGVSRPGKGTMLAYDALSTLLGAYNQLPISKSLRETVRKKLPDTNFQGITGWIQLSNISSNAVHKMIFVISVNDKGLGSIVGYCGKFTATVSKYDLSPQQDC